VEQARFLEGATPDKIAASLDEGVRVISGHSAEVARSAGLIRSDHARVDLAGASATTSIKT